jgi:hypothetical protein
MRRLAATRAACGQYKMAPQVLDIIRHDPGQQALCNIEHRATDECVALIEQV